MPGEKNWGLGGDMIFVTGPAYAGKQEYICSELGLSDEEFTRCGIRNVERLVADNEDIEALAEKLGKYDIVIMNETGCGIIPADAEERKNREKAGRLSCLLAKRADTVIRVVCSLPQILKGEVNK